MEKLYSTPVNPEMTNELNERFVIPPAPQIIEMTNEERAVLETHQEALKQEKDRIIKILSPRYNVSKTWGDLELKGKSKSGFTLKCKIWVKMPEYSFWLTVPSSWRNRLKVETRWEGTDFDTLLAQWDALLNEEESVLKPETYLYPDERCFEELKLIQENFEVLIEACRTDVTPEERVAIQKELEIHLSEDSTLDPIWGREIKGCYHLGALTYRYYLIKYKGLGFILSDAGNGHWNYISTAEEFLLNHHWDTMFHTKD